MIRTLARSVFGWAVLGLGTVVLAILALSLMLIPFVGVPAANFVGEYMWAPLMLWASGADLTIEGMENIDRNNPQILVCNHQGLLDIVTLIVHTPVSLRFVIKKSVAYVPLFGWYLKLVGHVFVDRANRSMAVKSLDDAAERIRRGVNIVSFAEGTRTRSGKILPFKKGPFMLALKSRVPLVPCAIDGSYQLVRKGSFALRPSHIRLRVGKPMRTDGLREGDRDEFMRKVRNEIIDMHLAIGGAGGDKEEAIAAPGVQGIGKAASTG